jgi:hypothetical protein
VIEQDNTTFTPGRAQLTMWNSLIDLQSSTDSLNVRFAQFLPPHQSINSGLYRVLRLGECFYSDVKKCTDEWPNYVPEVGYTKELMNTGLDEQMYTFIEAGKAFLAAANYTVNNPHFRLMSLMSDDFQESLGAVQRELLVFTWNTSQRDTILVIGTAVLILLSFMAMTYIGNRANMVY